MAGVNTDVINTLLAAFDAGQRQKEERAAREVQMAQFSEQMADREKQTQGTLERIRGQIENEKSDLEIRRTAANARATADAADLEVRQAAEERQFVEATEKQRQADIQSFITDNLVRKDSPTFEGSTRLSESQVLMPGQEGVLDRFRRPQEELAQTQAESNIDLGKELATMGFKGLQDQAMSAIDFQEASDLLQQRFDFDERLVGINSAADYEESLDRPLTFAEIEKLQGVVDEEGNPLIEVGSTFRDAMGLLPSIGKLSVDERSQLSEANQVDRLAFDILSKLSEVGADGETGFEHYLQGKISGLPETYTRLLVDGSTQAAEDVRADISELIVKLKELANFGAALTESEKTILFGMTPANLFQSTPQQVNAQITRLFDMAEKTRVTIYDSVIQGTIRAGTPLENPLIDADERSQINQLTNPALSEDEQGTVDGLLQRFGQGEDEQ